MNWRKSSLPVQYNIALDKDTRKTPEQIARDLASTGDIATAVMGDHMKLPGSIDAWFLIMEKDEFRLRTIRSFTVTVFRVAPNAPWTGLFDFSVAGAPSCTLRQTFDPELDREAACVAMEMFIRQFLSDMKDDANTMSDALPAT